MQLFIQQKTPRTDVRFQYPRSDRRRCNRDGCIGCWRWWDLSVSSVGSEAMQLIQCAWGRDHFRLSVSSVGSEAMQRSCMCWTSERLVLTFQYPRSDRRRCNPPPPAEDDLATLTFSILGRIGGDATPGSVVKPYTIADFQYPRSDRRRCNYRIHIGYVHLLQLSVSSVGSEAMQRRLSPEWVHGDIKLSVSSVGSEAMQRNPPGRPVHPDPPFSILGRIGGDATHQTGRTGCSEVGFQYPRSDRRRCNISLVDAAGAPVSLSVSSVGSEAMQPDACVPPRVTVPVLSVSSVGSEAMQLVAGEHGRYR